jgi:hypothetical protein
MRFYRDLDVSESSYPLPEAGIFFECRFGRVRGPRDESAERATHARTQDAQKWGRVRQRKAE